MHKTLFDENPHKEIMDVVAPHFHRHFWRVSLEYSYLQICKLHDPASSKTKTGISHNLSIAYVIEKLDWGESEKSSLETLAQKLDELNQRINPARSKVIAHNDRDILLRDEPIGGSRDGLDSEYFERLQEFVNCVSKKWLGRIYPFSSGAKNNADEYLIFLKSSDLAKARLSLRASRSHRDES